ncbi:O-methyltransferase [Streptomyces pratensis]|uniref:O-methyltransferase n=1 Tax=Streptomyces pratensis TaxID=1169025 RepID=UPI00301A1C32
MSVPPVRSTRLGLEAPEVREVLSRLHERAQLRDADVMRRAYADAAELSAPPTPAEASALCADALLPVAPHVGRLLYTLVRMLRPHNVVEFGTSFGASAIYLAAALRDNGAGHLTTSELEESKIREAGAGLADAGLADLVTIVPGDARQTLADLPGPVDLVLLDGWKELYLPVLKVLEPSLADHAVIVADNLSMLPEDYTAYVRDPANGYVSLDLPLGDGVELTSRQKAAR